MASTNSEPAESLRQLATMLRALADDLDAGHAQYLSGAVNFQIDPAPGLDKLGQAPLTGKLPHGKLRIEADAEFLTGQPGG